MPFIPHTDNDIDSMLKSIGVNAIDDLFDEIPAELRCGNLDAIPSGLSELQVTQLMHQRASEISSLKCFAGAGAYEHHIPAAIWEITTRGEFYSAYTPYQAEASQGSLQVIYEYQSMITALTGMEVSNASLYDGATALAEAVLMAVRGNRKSKSRRILIPGTLNPTYRKVTNAIIHGQNIELVEVPMQDGLVPADALAQHAGEDFAAVVIQQPNFFGQLEDVNAITNWAHANGALLIAVVNPTSLGLLIPPGEWGESGADIVCGEGQPLGIPVASGGPYFGFMCCKKALIRQMPGRIIGRTIDLDGKTGYTLTLQAREQHIRRSKATSNICTNQGLMVTAATQYMALTGGEGLQRIASVSWNNTQKVIDALTQIDGVEVVFDGPRFHECLLRLHKPADVILEQLADKGILGGYATERDFPELGNCLLICATETRTDQDIADFARSLAAIVAADQGEAA